jgi:hypothetical protein
MKQETLTEGLDKRKFTFLCCMASLVGHVSSEGNKRVDTFIFFTGKMSNRRFFSVKEELQIQ